MSKASSFMHVLFVSTQDFDSAHQDRNDIFSVKTQHSLNGKRNLAGWTKTLIISSNSSSQFIQVTLLPPPRRLCFCHCLSVCLSVCLQNKFASNF